VVVTAEFEDGKAALSVSDNGPGVPEGDHEHLFERFYRADGGKASGSGLGLAIARELAMRMEGAIELRSESGNTVFMLVLPLLDTAESVSTSKGSVEKAHFSGPRDAPRT
jgi:two-component system, OmpR family, sensor histidine kinase TctE